VGVDDDTKHTKHIPFTSPFLGTEMESTSFKIQMMMRLNLNAPPCSFFLCSKTAPFHPTRTILHKPIQESRPSTQQRLHKSLTYNVRSRRTRVRMIIRIQRIHFLFPHLLENVRRVRAVIHKHGAAPDLRRRVLAVRREAGRRVAEGASLPGIVGRGRRDDDLCALCDERLARVDQVRGIREHRHRLPVVHRRALFVAGAGAVGAPVVRGRQAAAVVVPEFDDHNVVGLHGFDDLVEAALDRVGTCAAPSDGFVDYRQAERVGNVDAPPCGMVSVGGRYEGGPTDGCF